MSDNNPQPPVHPAVVAGLIAVGALLLGLFVYALRTQPLEPPQPTPSATVTSER